MSKGALRPDGASGQGTSAALVSAVILAKRSDAALMPQPATRRAGTERHAGGVARRSGIAGDTLRSLRLASLPLCARAPLLISKRRPRAAVTGCEGILPAPPR